VGSPSKQAAKPKPSHRLLPSQEESGLTTGIEWTMTSQNVFSANCGESLTTREGFDLICLNSAAAQHSAE